MHRHASILRIPLEDKLYMKKRDPWPGWLAFVCMSGSVFSLGACKPRVTAIRGSPNSTAPASSAPPKVTSRDIAAAEAKVELYFCPIHPQISSTQPGVCPICQLHLVRTSQGPPESRPATTENSVPRSASVFGESRPVLLAHWRAGFEGQDNINDGEVVFKMEPINDTVKGLLNVPCK